MKPDKGVMVALIESRLHSEREARKIKNQGRKKPGYILCEACYDLYPESRIAECDLLRQELEEQEIYIREIEKIDCLNCLFNQILMYYLKSKFAI